MKQIVTRTETEVGERIHISYLEQLFLNKNVDLGLDFDIFGHPLKNYLQLPESCANAPVFDFVMTSGLANELTFQLENDLLSSIGIGNSEILVYIYTLAENATDRYLFVTRITTELSIKSRLEWSQNYDIDERDCCFKNYCKDFNLNQLNNKNHVSLEKLDENCHFKKVFVDITPLIWCYDLNSPSQKKSQEVGFGFTVKRSGLLGGMPLAMRFPYGSMFKKNMTKKTNNEEEARFIDIDCKNVYDDLSKKDQFFSFIRDSLNTTCLAMVVTDEIYKKLDKNLVFSYRFLGCSFYL